MRVFWPLRGGIARRFARPIPGGPPASGAPGLGGDACFWPLRGGIARRSVSGRCAAASAALRAVVPRAALLRRAHPRHDADAAGPAGRRNAVET
jgi:hypothetical protein